LIVLSTGADYEEGLTCFVHPLIIQGLVSMKLSTGKSL